MEIQVLDWTQAKALAEAIRKQVFIVEQAVPPAEEWDKWDAFAVHTIAIENGKAVGTARLTREGKVGRMAVLKAHRGQGIGAAMLETLIEVAQERHMSKLSLHAQCYAEDFYAKFGFQRMGETFLEVEIPHIKMQLSLKA